MENHDLPDFATAARCIPLWYQFRGIPALYDPVKGVQYAIYNQRPAGINQTFWNDLQAFKVESTRGYMNAIADALKKGVADVPVVYKWTQHSPLFTNTADSGGYDGLGIEAYGHGLALSRDAGAYAYAQAEETPKTTWLIVSDTAEAPAGGEDRARLRLQGQPVRRLGRPQGHRRARLLRRGTAASAGGGRQKRQPPERPGPARLARLLRRHPPGVGP